MQKSALLRSVDTVPASALSGVFKRKPASDAADDHAPPAVSRNVLLLQGPVGPFFARFADDLTSRGFKVTKVNFNGGDRYFYKRRPSLDYTGTLEEWEAWLERVLINCQIGRVYLFGDCRSYHRIARSVAKKLGVKVFVFEEGYIRPNFITLEEDGVNGHSTMMDRPFRPNADSLELVEEKQQPAHVFQLTALYSMLYYMAIAASRRQFSNYRHHRPINCLAEGVRWIRSGLRKRKYAKQEKSLLHDVMTQYEGNYFVCPLQVHCDMQVVVHSDFNSIEHFIGDVLASFREHASSNKAIVFKHHPLDRGYTDYSSLFDNLIAELGLQGRVFYVHDLCLPTLLKNAQGTVLINSTVGISSLFHGTPVKTMGKAIYDVPGLTAQESLDDFWSCKRTVDSQLFQAFRSFLINRNQLNGNLYRRVSNSGATGLLWSDDLAAQHSWPDSAVEQKVESIEKKVAVERNSSGAPALTVVAGTSMHNQFRPDENGNAKAA